MPMMLEGNAINITQSGVYYARGNIDLHNVTADAGVQVTFVADGRINLNGSTLNGLQGYSSVVSGDHVPPGSNQVGLVMASDYGTATSHENPPSGNCSGQDAIKVQIGYLHQHEGPDLCPTRLDSVLKQPGRSRRKHHRVRSQVFGLQLRHHVQERRHVRARLHRRASQLTSPATEGGHTPPTYATSIGYPSRLKNAKRNLSSSLALRAERAKWREVLGECETYGGIARL